MSNVEFKRASYCYTGSYNISQIDLCNNQVRIYPTLQRRNTLQSISCCHMTITTCSIWCHSDKYSYHLGISRRIMIYHPLLLKQNMDLAVAMTKKCWFPNINHTDCASISWVVSSDCYWYKNVQWSYCTGKIPIPCRALLIIMDKGYCFGICIYRIRKTQWGLLLMLW